MPPQATLPPLPPSFAALLAEVRSCFTTAPTFTTFCAMVCGMLAGTGRRTVCGMLVGAGLSRVWRHHRAHRFFSRAKWSSDEVGLVLARLVVRLLVPEGPVTVAVDDTLYRRTGRSVFAVGWFHDGSAKSREKLGYGNNWVVAGIAVTIPVLGRVVCLPVLARLVRKGTDDASRLEIAVQMAVKIAENLPGRTVHGVGDAAYAGKAVGKLPENVTWTTRVRKDAALYRPAPPPTGRRGRPRLKGDKLPKLEQIAAGLTFTPATVTRYGKTETAYLASFACLWPGVFGYKKVLIVLVRNKPGIPRGGYYDIALATTDTDATAAQVVARYACRWSIEIAIEDSKQVFGVGQARNRVQLAVERTVPFGLSCQTLATLWYAVAGHHPSDVADHRERAPWYTTKRHPSTADLAGKLRRTLIAARFSGGHPEGPTSAEIHAIQLAWAADDCIAA